MAKDTSIKDYFDIGVLCVALCLAGAILLFDTLAPVGVAGGVAYVVVVSLGWLLRNARFLYVLSVGTTCLAILGPLLASNGINAEGVVWVNIMLAILAIWCVTLLISLARKSLRKQAAEQARQAQLATTHAEELQEHVRKLTDKNKLLLSSQTVLANTLKKLEQSEMRFDLVVEGAAVGIWDWMDISKSAEWWSPKFYQLLGYQQGEIEATTDQFTAMLHPDDVEPTWAAVNEHFAGKAPFNVQYRLRTKSGNYRWFWGTGQVQWNDAGEPIRMVGSIIDIHSRKSAQEQFRKVFDTDAVGMALVNAEGKPYKANERLAKMLGYSGEELAGMPFTQFTHPEDVNVDVHLYGELLEGKRDSYQMQKRYVRKDGSIVWALLAVSLMHDGNGVPEYAIGIVQDISEQKSIELQLRAKTGELEASNKDLARFAYVASHDLQEPLGTIISYVDLLSRKLDGRLDKSELRFMEHLGMAATRLRTLIADILEYSRIGRSPVWAQVDTQLLVNEVLESLSAEIKRTNATVVAINLPTILAARDELLQVFRHLISNAIKFHRQSTPPNVRIVAKDVGNAIDFLVEDNGIGIAPEYEERIFTIFQQLHNRQKYPGNGIGLAICRKSVELHGGSITLVASSGEGTVFQFNIPKDLRREA